MEVSGSALQGIPEKMGEALVVRASCATNIKERRDCSTALFDHRGTTLCQAGHIPRHLGSFPDVIPAIWSWPRTPVPGVPRTVTCPPLGAPEFKLEIGVTACRGASKAGTEHLTISLAD